jgi:hypothetical protein
VSSSTGSAPSEVAASSVATPSVATLSVFKAAFGSASSTAGSAMRPHQPLQGGRRVEVMGVPAMRGVETPYGE